MIRAAGGKIAGCVLLVFVTVSGAVKYRATSQHAQVETIRRELAADAARINSMIESGGCRDFQQLEVELQRIRKENPNRIAWMQTRDERGNVKAHAGMRAAATFPIEFVRSQLRKRRPVFAVTQTEAGSVLLEVFPVRLPRGLLPGVIEIAARLDGGAPAPIALQNFI